MIERNREKSCWRFTFLISLLVIITACGGPDEEELVSTARGYIGSRDYNAAVLELKNVLKVNAGNAEARYLLGHIYLSMGVAASAEKELQYALDAGWDEAVAQLSLAEALFRQGKFQRVLDDIPLKDVYPVDTRADLLGIRASAEAGLGQWDKAAEALDAGTSISPDALWVLQSKVKLQVHSGDLSSAERTVAQGLQIHPSSQDMWLLKAELSEKTGKSSEAKAALQKVIELEAPGIVTLWGRQARLFLSQAWLADGDYAKADAILDPVLATSPDDPLTNYQAGLIAIRQGQYDLSQERLLKVLNAAPGHMPTLLLFGTLNYLRNDYQQAAYYLEKAAAAQPDSLDAQVLLGKTYLMLGQYEEAENRFKAASSMAGGNADLLALLGISRLRGGDVQAGLKDLETAAEREPADASVRDELARAYLNTGDTRRAINMLESALEENKEQYQTEATEALLILAYLRASEYEKAIDLAQELLVQLPENPLPHIAIGMAYEGKKDYTNARRSYNKLLSFKPDDIQALLGHARLDMNEGNSAGARERYQAVLAIQPDHLNALVSLAYLMDREGDSEEAITLLEKARQASPTLLEPRLILSNFYLEQRDTDKALVYAREAYGIKPKDRRVLLVLGKAQLGANENAAQETLLQLAERAPDFPEAHFYLALAQARSGDRQGARKSLQKALKLNPDHTQARFALGNLELNDGNAVAALEIAHQLQKVESDSAAGYLLEGDVMMSRRETEKALSAYQSALDHAQSSAIVIRINKVQRMLGNTQAGYDALLEWIEQHPDDVLVRLALASSHMEDGQKEAAKAQFRKIIEKQPDNAAALNDLAWLTHESGEPGAVEMAERAHHLAPDNAAIQDTYGWLLVQTGRVEQGLIALEQAAKKAPNIYDIRYHLAVALAKAGDKARARQELKSILEPGKPFTERNKAQALLDELSS